MALNAEDIEILDLIRVQADDMIKRDTEGHTEYQPFTAAQHRLLLSAFFVLSGGDETDIDEICGMVSPAFGCQREWVCVRDSDHDDQCMNARGSLYGDMRNPEVD